jgi:hypothetical protein
MRSRPLCTNASLKQSGSRGRAAPPHCGAVMGGPELERALSAAPATTKPVEVPNLRMNDHICCGERFMAEVELNWCALRFTCLVGHLGRRDLGLGWSVGKQRMAQMLRQRRLRGIVVMIYPRVQGDIRCYGR